jgi:hypothetical protein
LRADGHSEDDQVQHLDHLKVRIRALGNENRANVEQHGLSHIDQSTRYAVRGALDKSAAHPYGQHALSSALKLTAEDALEGHTPDTADI